MYAGVPKHGAGTRQARRPDRVRVADCFTRGRRHRHLDAFGRQPEVSDARDASVEQDVAGFEIAMDDVPVVERSEPGGDLAEAGSGPHRVPEPSPLLFQRSTVDQRHDQKQASIGDADVEHGQQVRLILIPVAIWASRASRAAASGATRPRSVLSANRCRSATRSTSYTVPIPPAPSLRTTR